MAMRRPQRGFTLVELMITVGIIGLLAAIAMPSFIFNLRRAQTTEAMMNIRKMYDGAVAYFVADHPDAAGVNQPHTFPPNDGPTPSTIPHGTKVLVPAVAWDTPGWAALGFYIRDYQRYSYSFVAQGQEGGATASLIAQGDLNGNGIPSTYLRSAAGVQGGGVTGGSGLYVVSDVE
jgi:prepilin-type N-terminal cleavage/methylation domain-containing protein